MVARVGDSIVANGSARAGAAPVGSRFGRAPTWQLCRKTAIVARGAVSECPQQEGRKSFNIRCLMVVVGIGTALA